MKNIKERNKFEHSDIFEGIVSFRAVIDAINTKNSQRKIQKVYYDASKSKKRPKELSFLKAKSYELGFEIELTDSEKIDSITVGNSHGGLCFSCSERSLPTLSAENIVQNGFYVFLHIRHFLH